VAGIARGQAWSYAGANPGVKLVDLKVMNAQGVGMTSDVIHACQWILDHKSTYNIRVANFSLHSDIAAPFYFDPLDRAVEQLWFHGIVVVTAAGVGEVSANDALGVTSPPNPNVGLDKFVVTTTSNGTTGISFDSASWNSAAQASASWDSASWNSSAWSTASWNSASWNSASGDWESWNSASWNSASWNWASWDSASWESRSAEDAAEGDSTTDVKAIELSPYDVAQLLADPGFDAMTLPDELHPKATPTSSPSTSPTTLPSTTTDSTATKQSSKKKSH
jgi:hypothetical protein